jgi:hypothetical protein
VLTSSYECSAENLLKKSIPIEVFCKTKKSIMNNPSLVAIVIGVLVAITFAGGFALSDWRSEARIRKLTTDNTVLTVLHQECKANAISHQKPNQPSKWRIVHD